MPNPNSQTAAERRELESAVEETISFLLWLADGDTGWLTAPQKARPIAERLKAAYRSSATQHNETDNENAEWMEDFAADWDSEVSKRTSERLMSSAAELRAYESLQATTSLEMQADQTTRELVKGALDETRELVRSLPEELFVLRKQVKSGNKALIKLASGSKDALDIITKHGFVFKTDLTRKDLNEAERWEKLAFSLYSEIVGHSTLAEHALEEIAEHKGTER